MKNSLPAVALALALGVLAAMLSLLPGGSDRPESPDRPREVYTLSISIEGSGHIGNINDAEIHCPPDCSEAYTRIDKPDTSPYVEAFVKASPDEGAAFLGWSGPACRPAREAYCLLLMNRDRTITAHFSDTGVTPSLTVTRSGSGSGSVTSARVAIGTEASVRTGAGHIEVTDDLSGIECGRRCSAQYGSGAGIVLTAAPDDGSTFSGWSGPDADCLSRTKLFCVVRIEGAERVTATFSTA